jgi:hypothetical protein
MESYAILSTSRHIRLGRALVPEDEVSFLVTKTLMVVCQQLQHSRLLDRRPQASILETFIVQFSIQEGPMAIRRRRQHHTTMTRLCHPHHNRSTPSLMPITAHRIAMSRPQREPLQT